ncbi:hypothetical protein ABFS83_03G002400 [Erythranthe nasuta]
MRRKSSSIMRLRRSSSTAASLSQIQFPTSAAQPSTNGGEYEITHYTHSNHPLTQLNLSQLFTCDGCKEYGAGTRFSCQHCDFQLHDFCAAAPPLLNNHPLHGQHQLVFHSKPKSGGMSWPTCDVCGKSTKGFTFRCRACNFQMHPCCAMLSSEVNFPAHPHPLRVLPPLNGAPMDCGECKKRRSKGRIYRCTVCSDYHLHALCAKPFVNGLQANGIPTPGKPPSALGTAARLASQVVIEFIGGLIEGIGEGMGEALVQNMVRGRCISRRTRVRE